MHLQRAPCPSTACSSYVPAPAGWIWRAGRRSQRSAHLCLASGVLWVQPAHPLAASCTTSNRHDGAISTSSSHACSRPGSGRLRRQAKASAAAAVDAAAAPHLRTGSASTPRRLILLRHADSESSSAVRDHERPISHQGRREAAAIARRLATLGWIPDLILASNSRRTRQTLDAMCEAHAPLSDADAHYLGSLYTVAALDGQTRGHLEECIANVVDDAKHACVMAVGHNKGWEEAAGSFAGQPVRLSTASAALLEAGEGGAERWADALGEGVDWRLVDVLQP